jgi:hypothetical protein
MKDIIIALIETDFRNLSIWKANFDVAKKGTITH